LAYAAKERLLKGYEMVQFLHIILVCYMPILEVFVPRTNFGSGIPDIGPVRLLSYMVVLAFIVESCLRQQIKIFSKWIVIIATYSVIVIASVSWSDYSYSASVLANIFDSVVLPLGIAIIAFSVFRERSNVNSYVKHIMIAALILSVISIYQLAMAGPSVHAGSRDVRSAATMGNPNALAVFLVLTVPCILYVIEKRLVATRIGWLIFASVLAGIVCTISRKGFVTGILVFVLYYLLKKQVRKIVIFSLAVSVIAIGVSGYSIISGRFSKENLNRSIVGRSAMVHVGLKMFWESPIVGLGYKGYYENSHKYLRGSKKWVAHNIFITALTNYGIVGFIPFLGIFLYPLSFSTKIIRSHDKTTWAENAKDMAIICICSVVPFMISGFFAGGLFYKPETMFLLYSNTALVLSYSQRRSNIRATGTF